MSSWGIIQRPCISLLHFISLIGILSCVKQRTQQEYMSHFVLLAADAIWPAPSSVCLCNFSTVMHCARINCFPLILFLLRFLITTGKAANPHMISNVYDLMHRATEPQNVDRSLKTVTCLPSSPG